ncbi:hypothetical protein NQZ79_g6572 [Umbelopsis isabellina]|nr:hypothetical protein NQZ79_g6572 [Umbelopsis isabellina]
MSQLQNLANYSVCEIADALLKLGHKPWAGYLADIEMWSPTYCSGNTKILGPAYTVKADAAPEGSVIVISAPAGSKNGVWGGLMSASAKAKNVQGVVVDGRVRDLAEHRDMGMPVFARSHSILSLGAMLRPSELNVPVTMSTCPVTVHPGDIIVGDQDGVVCVPQNLIDQVVASCDKYVAIDNQCMVDISKGKGVQETFAKYRGSK